jgi:hypothetical protein
MIKNHFTVGIIEAGISLSEELELNHQTSIQDIIRVKESTGNLTEDYKNAESLILDYGEKLFKDSGKFESLRKDILYSMISILNPPWKNILRQGKNLFYDYVGELYDGGNIVQVFSHAELNDESEESITWWKLISNLSGLDEFNNREKLGLEGEILTIKYEKQILKKLDINRFPNHVAAEDPSAGYDVASWRKDENNNLYEVFIESKMSSLQPSKFYLTRNEYETSLIKSKDYCVYLWNTNQTPGNEPQKFYTKWLENNTPTDSGESKWTEILISPNESDSDIW